MVRPVRINLARRRRGFTAMELIMSLMVVGMILGALMGLTYAVSTQWDNTDTSMSLQEVATQAAKRVEWHIRQAKYFGLCRTGSIDGSATTPAAVMFWQNDSNSADGQIELLEIGMLQHDTTTNTLYFYQAVFPSNWPSWLINAFNTTYSYSAITASNAPETFKNLSYVVGVPVCHNVKGVRFAVSDLNAEPVRPCLDFVLNFSTSGHREGQAATFTQLQYGSATLQTPSPQPP